MDKCTICGGDLGSTSKIELEEIILHVGEEGILTEDQIDAVIYNFKSLQDLIDTGSYSDADTKYTFCFDCGKYKVVDEKRI